jgi:hypothetical protein
MRETLAQGRSGLEVLDCLASHRPPVCHCLDLGVDLVTDGR